MLDKKNVPFYEECSFGYFEWFVKSDKNEIVIYKIPTLAPFKRIISDKEYKLDIKYLPELSNREKFINRNEAYALVKKYWNPNEELNYLKFVKIKVDKDMDDIKLFNNEMPKQISLFG
ncbi:hypothetical protein ACWO4B_003203 [Clostridium sporogenes]